MLEVTGLTKNYGQKEVLKGIDLKIEDGEIFGFLGRNGAGKSTFINILTGLAKQTSGTVTFFDGEPLTTNLKKRLGVLPDYSMFYGHLNAIDHLRYFASISGKNISKKHAQDILTKVGLGKDSKLKVEKYSFGMKKKLGFAQAIVHDPDFIFLDEPTSGVDAESAIVLHTLIRDLQKQGKTIFLTSHNLNEMEKLCDRIAILKDGNIAKIGQINALKTAETTETHVQIKHSVLTNTVREQLLQVIAPFSKVLVQDVDWLTIQVASEQEIPMLVRAFIGLQIDIFRVEVAQKSLEEIFIDAEK